MRKTLLLTLALGAFLKINATNPYHGVRKIDKLQKNKNFLDGQQFSMPNYNLAPNQTPNQFVAASGPVLRINAGSSPNLFTSIFGMQNSVYANQDLGLITLTRRRNEGDPGDVGYVQTSFSTNMGASFDTTLAVVSDDVNLCRYPSGAIYNPAGNTNPLNAFVVASGPWHPGADWQGNYFGSVRINGSNGNVVIQDNLTTLEQKFDFARTNIQSTSNGKVYVTSAEYTNVNGTTAVDQGFQKGVLNIGTFNSTANAFDWTTRAFPHNFKLDPVDNTPRTYTTSTTAWSEDGQVGYYVYIGEDATSSFNSYQPIVYTTTNAGTTWSLMPVYDFRNLTSITDSLRATSAGTKRPFFTQTHGIDAVVDKYNRLHLFSAVLSASSDDVDSIDFAWNFPIHLFDVVTSPCGSWSAIHIDALKTSDVVAANSIWTYDGGVGWDARLQMGRTTDGSKVFYSWIDTDPAVWGDVTENLFPDVIGRAYDVETKKLTPIINFTADDIVNAGKNYWYFSSNIVLQNDTTYIVPSTIADSRVAGDDGSGAISHYYLKGIEFTESQFNISAFSCPVVSGDVTTVNDVCNTGVGSATLNISNPSNYCYSWDNVVNSTNTFSGFSAGNHTVTIYDNNGCSTSFPFTVGGSLGVTSAQSSSTQSSSCLAIDGSATVTIEPAPQSYSWNTTPPQTTATATGLAAGVYVCTIVSSTGCSIPYTVNVTPINGSSPNATATAALCIGTATGTATSAPTGGTSPYTYSWNTTPVQTTATATNLLPGDYIVTVTDAEGCSSTQTVSVGNASAITLGSSTVTGNNSTSNPDGSATVVVEGGAGGFSYSWNTTPAQTTNSATNLLAGNYTVTVTDANNCTVSFTVTVPSFTALKENAVTNSVSVFPNPTNGIISLKIENLQLNNAVVKVINLSGQTVYSNNLRNFANGTTTIDLSNQSNGVYFVQVVSDKEVITKRIIKTKN
jgi:hypothetical protein